MSDFAQVRKCYNCGTLLQSDNPNEKGYVKKEILDNPLLNFVFCDECFEKEKFHARPNEPELDDEYYSLVMDAKNNHSLIVYVINLFSFEASFNSKLNNLIKNNKILVIANKRDLLPSDLKDETIEEYVAHRFRAVDLHVDKVMVTSESNDEINRQIIETIQEMRQGHNTYVIGPKYSGKTSLINAFLRVYHNLSKGMIMTKNYKNTKMRVMMIPLDDDTYMYDTPGISNDNSLLANLDPSTIDLYLSSRGCEKKSILLSKNQAICLGGYAMIELVSSDKDLNNLSLYFRPNKITYKKIAPRHKNTVDDLFFELVAKGALTPALKTMKSLKDMTVYEIHVDETNQRDIGILGFGWFSFIAHNQVFRIYVPHNVSVYTSRPKIIDKRLR